MAKHVPLPNQALLKQLLSYNPETGDLQWMPRPYLRHVKASTVTPRGSLVVEIDHTGYQASRIVWMLIHGVDPQEKEVVFLDGDKTNLRLNNLRLATPTLEMAKRATRADNTTGIKGVTRRRGSWEARIGFEGKRIHLGTFKTAEAAAAAYAAKAAELFGEFANP